MATENIYSSVYSSAELAEFLNGLENKYGIEDAQDRYSKLVNFSQNAVVPYHQWFRYREGFSAELIQKLIKESGARNNEAIIDPFCGSGTTNVVAAAEGYNTVGLDVNPMSAFITNAKIRFYDDKDPEQALSAVDCIDTFNDYTVRSFYEDIRKYFNENNFLELVRIKNFIEQIEEGPVKDLYSVAFLSCVEMCSDRRRDGNGLKTVKTKINDPSELFKSKVKLIVSDIKSNRLKKVTGVGVCGSAFDLVTEYNKYCGNVLPGAIIFSPPYANSFDYFESYKLELVFGDFVRGMAGLGELRKKAVRSFVGGAKQVQCDKYVDMIADEIEAVIPLKEKETGKKDSRTRKVPDMLRGYFADMREVIRQCARCLPVGKCTYIIVDQSAYLGKIVPTDLLLAYLGESEGFEVTKIINCRTARTSTQQLNKYPYLKTALRESIVCLKRI